MRNRYEVRGNDLIIFLDRRSGDTMQTVTDAGKLEKLMQYDIKWCAMKDHTTKIEDKYYVMAQYNGTSILMHRILLDADKGELVDHRDGDRLNNREGNLRKVSHSLNSLNRSGAEMRSSTGIHGVFKSSRRNSWIARVKYKQKIVYERHFKTIGEAEKAVVKARKRVMLLETIKHRLGR